MVPLLLEEGYRADGWLGMLLGTRMWYGFLGANVESESAFEGKIEELCRELGERGKIAVAVDSNRCDQTATVAEELRMPGAERVSILGSCLECAEQLLLSVRRQRRKKLSTRIDHRQDELEAEESPPWLMSEWTAEDATAAAEAVVALRCVRCVDGEDVGEDVTVGVTGLLSALDGVAAAHEDRAAALLSVLRGGGEEGVAALAGVLEHGLAVLDALSVATPRRGRRAVREVCERVEGVLEDDLAEIASQLVWLEDSQLLRMCTGLVAVESMDNADVAASALQSLNSVVVDLQHITDPAITSIRLLECTDAQLRLRGLSALAGLERVALRTPSDMEVLAASTAAQMTHSTPENNTAGVTEQTSAFWAVFVLSLRNRELAFDALEKAHQIYEQDWWSAQSICKLQSQEEVELMFAGIGVVSMSWSFSSTKTPRAIRSRVGKLFGLFVAHQEGQGGGERPFNQTPAASRSCNDKRNRK
eukprot:COSAG01_NODE_5073_length_4506_cov_3.537781_2_plen_476_part_00